MKSRDDLNFDELFDDSEKQIGSEFEDLFGPEKKEEEEALPAIDAQDVPETSLDSKLPLVSEDEIPEIKEEEKNPAPPKRKRTSQDFQPDMDALLITAQSPLVIEGTKYLLSKNYSCQSFSSYAEAIKGIDLFIKILDRNPQNYRKLSSIIQQDLDCREVEKIAFNMYKAAYKEEPETDDQKIKAFDILKNQLRFALKKATISVSMTRIKKYFLMSGGLDEEKVASLIKNNDSELYKAIDKTMREIKTGIELMKMGYIEIARGLKGKDLNIYLVKATQLLYFYFKETGNQKNAEYYKRLNNNYKQYYIVK